MTLLAISRKHLHATATYAILSSVSRNALDGKVNGDDSNERAILHPRAGSRRATSVNRYNYAPDQSKEAKGFSSREPMENWRNRSRAVSRRAEQYPRSRPEINKATVGWHMTIKKFTAVWLPHRGPGKIARDNPWCTLPVFMIHSCAIKCKAMYLGGVGTGKKVYP